MTSTTLTRTAFLRAARDLGVTDAMRSDITAAGYEARQAARQRYSRVACAILRASADLAWARR